jgi:hypothetical protein
VNDGYADEYNGTYGEGDIFNTSYNEVSGLFCVWFNDNANEFPPWFGCLGHGQHNIQFFVDNQSTDLTPFFVDDTWPEAFASPGYLNHQITIWADLVDFESGIDTTEVEADLKNCLDIIDLLTYEVEAEAMTFTPIEGGYRASFQLQWEQIAFLFEGNINIPMTLCVHWEIWNKVCLYNETSHDYIYTIDIEGPQVIPVSPVGAGIDEDGDGLVNEDWRDCINNDNDFWWDDVNGLWHERVDEDPVNYEVDTINFGERPTIEALINDLVVCGSGASGVDLTTFWLNIDGTIFTMADTTN